MFDLNAKRRKTIASLFSLSLAFVLVVSCTATPVINLAHIATKANTLVTLIDLTEKTFYIASKLVNISYGELKQNINNENFVVGKKFSNELIENMETRYSDLSTKHQELDNSIDKTNTAANDLFSTLETRANQNSRPDLQEKSLRGIHLNKKAFTEKIEVAENVSSKLKLSIKEYDNILNFLQVTTVLDASQKYITTVDSVISQYETLNQEVQAALNEGRQIVANTPGVPSQEPKVGTVPTPEPSENTTEQSVVVPTPIPSENTTEQSVNHPLLGVNGIGLTPEGRQQIKQDKNLQHLLLNVDNVDGGVLVVEVVNNSSAAEVGIQAGDIILTINGKSVTDVSEITAELKKYQAGAELPLVIHRNQQNLEALVRLKANPNTSNLQGENN
ncbi:MAG: PDZ domain-containing protein [Desmonostoc vinosum HA7617-LM4]|nr:PDZ domain-containing protein [Desmonostoc vinosum HA7617-LM4]